MKAQPHRPPANAELWVAIVEPGWDRSGVDLVCPSCRRAWVELKSTGLAGCPACYETFGRLIARLNRLYDRQTSAELQAEALGHCRQTELQRALAQEWYESAAWLRDLIDADRVRP